MNRHFVGQNKFLWGFSLKKNGKFHEDFKISAFQASAVKKFVDHAYESDSEIHVMPNEAVPFVMIKANGLWWYYLKSESEARDFMREIMIAGSHELCQVM